MRSLRFRLIHFVAIAIFLSVGVVGMTAYLSSKKNQTLTVNELLHQTAAKAAEDIYNANEKEFVFLNTIARAPLFRDRNVPLEQKLQQLLAYMMDNPKKYQSIALLDENGMAHFANGYSFDFSQGLYYKEAKAGRNFISNPQYDPQLKIVSMFYAVPLYDMDNKFAGAIMSVIMGDWITQISNSITVGKGSHPIIISQRTKETISGISDRIAAGKEAMPVPADDGSPYSLLINDVISGNTSECTYIDPETNLQMCGAYRPVGTNCDWVVLASAPYDDYYKHLNQLLTQIVVFVIIALTVAGLASGFLITRMVRPLIVLKEKIFEIATGNADLRRRLKVMSQDEVGKVVDSFNTFTEKLQNIIFGIKESKDELIMAGDDLNASTQDTSAAITQIIANIESVHRQINSQSDSVHETAGAVNEIASNIESLEKMIENQSTGVHQASAAVEEMIGNIDSVNKSVSKMSTSFEHLTSSAQEGSNLQTAVNDKIEMIRTQSETLQQANLAISSIAEQTNLLAMNAAIEAAHAGEAGKGFSVVADEIRKLSETSSEQSKTIGEQLTQIQASIISVVEASQKSSEAFLSVITEINDTDEMVQLIKSAMDEQTEGSRQISIALRDMTDSTLEVRTASQEMAEGNKQILNEVRNLQDATGVMLRSMEEMSVGATKINETGVVLTEISGKIQNSIGEIGERIDEFEV
ncbi:MAG: methyl-accepting chemotaxis protein [Treponema sp.]|nr:methyl-accepting chemotaxis protein [Treponema sp.]